VTDTGPSGRSIRPQDLTGVIFDTQANARAALDAMITQRPPQAPPVESSAVYEVVLEV
jgi:hypothetical protein